MTMLRFSALREPSVIDAPGTVAPAPGEGSPASIPQPVVQQILDANGVVGKRVRSTPTHRNLTLLSEEEAEERRFMVPKMTRDQAIAVIQV